MATDQLAQLDKDVQTAVRRAVEKARWTHEAADCHLPGMSMRVHAYPLRRSAGMIYWGVISSEHGQCIAQGIM
jgi:hypothetical protein